MPEDRTTRHDPRSPTPAPDHAATSDRGAAPDPASAIIACEMIEDEVLLALDRSFPYGHPPLVWLESGLHDRPNSLKDALQDIVQRLDEGARTGREVTVPTVDRRAGPAGQRTGQTRVPPVRDVLLAMGYCGGGLSGLVSHEARLIFPRVDDCISLFLNPGCRREEIERDPRSYYLTQGWFRHSTSMNDDFDAWIERHGRERAEHLRRLLYAAYERITLIDTGAYDVDSWLERSHAHARELELDHTLVRGYVHLLERLFTGPWNSEIVVVPPGRPVEATCLLAS